MVNFTSHLMKCHFGSVSEFVAGEEPNIDFCAFEFPRCKGCSKSPLMVKSVIEDPIISAIWHGWINGMTNANAERN